VLGLALLAIAPGAVRPSGALAAHQAGTPVIATPAAPAATPAAAAPAVTATAAPTAPAKASTPSTDVVTLVAWYANTPSGEYLDIMPIAVAADIVASEQPGAPALGAADFPDEGVPTVRIADTDFDSYPRGEGDIPERWTWFDDFEGARPATLVLQVTGRGGAYDGYFGTITFISRDEGGVGGVIVFALRPPGSRERQTDGAADTGNGGDSTPDGAAASEPDPSLPDQTDLLTEPAA
ncbi:MAG: hypothetical protein ACR2J8_15350, partial [Thermomicrobiales bacterium]